MDDLGSGMTDSKPLLSIKQSSGKLKVSLNFVPILYVATDSYYALDGDQANGFKNRCNRKYPASCETEGSWYKCLLSSPLRVRVRVTVSKKDRYD